MRVIEHHMVQAFKKCVHGNLSRYRTGNTSVWRKGTKVCISLHGNTIITHDITCPNEYLFDTCGWYTRTTFSRMNTFAHIMGIDVRFYTNKHISFVRDRGQDHKLFGRHFHTIMESPIR